MLELAMNLREAFTEKGPTRAFSSLKMPFCAFTFKTVVLHLSSIVS